MLLCLYLPSSNRMLVRLVFLLSFLQLGCCIYSVFCLSFCLFWRINVFISLEQNKLTTTMLHFRHIQEAGGTG